MMWAPPCKWSRYGLIPCCTSPGSPRPEELVAEYCSTGVSGTAVFALLVLWLFMSGTIVLGQQNAALIANMSFRRRILVSTTADPVSGILTAFGYRGTLQVDPLLI